MTPYLIMQCEIVTSSHLLAPYMHIQTDVMEWMQRVDYIRGGQTDAMHVADVA